MHGVARGSGGGLRACLSCGAVSGGRPHVMSGRMSRDVHVSGQGVCRPLQGQSENRADGAAYATLSAGRPGRWTWGDRPLASSIVCVQTFGSFLQEDSLARDGFHSDSGVGGAVTPPESFRVHRLGGARSPARPASWSPIAPDST